MSTTVDIPVALVPGLPHLLAGEPAPSWRSLRDAVEQVGERTRDRVDTWIVVSTQWFTVLGFQFHTAERLVGRHVDENWYGFDFGDLAFDLSIDTEVTESWIRHTEQAGFQAHRTDYEGFPVDTGTISALQLLDPHHRQRIASASMNLYAGPEAMTLLGECARSAAEERPARVGILMISGLSSGSHQTWIRPDQDRIFSADHDAWNQRILTHLRNGDLDAALGDRAEYAANAAADSQFRAIAFLAGTGLIAQPADVLAYGPIWGTGAAVILWGAHARTSDVGQ